MSTLSQSFFLSFFPLPVYQSIYRSICLFYHRRKFENLLPFFLFSFQGFCHSSDNAILKFNPFSHSIPLSLYPSPIPQFLIILLTINCSLSSFQFPPLSLSLSLSLSLCLENTARAAMSGLWRNLQLVYRLDHKAISLITG